MGNDEAPLPPGEPSRYDVAREDAEVVLEVVLLRFPPMGSGGSMECVGADTETHRAPAMDPWHASGASWSYVSSNMNSSQPAVGSGAMKWLSRVSRSCRGDTNDRVVVAAKSVVVHARCRILNPSASSFSTAEGRGAVGGIFPRRVYRVDLLQPARRSAKPSTWKGRSDSSGVSYPEAQSHRSVHQLLEWLRGRSFVPLDVAAGGDIGAHQREIHE